MRKSGTGKTTEHGYCIAYLPLSLKELGKQGKQNYPRFRGGETEARAGDSSERAKAVTELASKPQ